MNSTALAAQHYEPVAMMNDGLVMCTSCQQGMCCAGSYSCVKPQLIEKPGQVRV